MKYCSNCGKEILEKAVICPYCGCMVAENEISGGRVSNQIIGENKASTALILSIIGLFVLGFLGIIGIVMANDSKNYTSGVMCSKARAAFIIGIIDVVGWAFLLMGAFR